MQPESFEVSGITPLPFFTPVEAEQAVAIVFAIAFIFWAIFSLISAYHWLRYGNRSSIAIPALITHLVVSSLIAMYAVSGFVA